MRTNLLLALGLLAAADATAQGAKPAATPVTVVRPTNIATGLGSTAHGSVQVTAVNDGDASLQGWTQVGGARAYGIVVPPGGKVTARLRHARAGYFKVTHKVVHHLGYIPERCLSGDPMDCFNNATDHPIDVYFVVHDPDHQADEKSPYTLEFSRSWKPGSGNSTLKLRDQLSL